MIGDILLPNDGKISIKGTFKGIADVRLLNKMGEGDREWKIATLFVVSGLGVVFGAPDMVDETHLKNVEDAVVIKKEGLKVLANNPNNVISMKIAQKPPTEVAGFSQKASTAVARQIFLETDSTTLLQAFTSDHEQQGM